MVLDLPPELAKTAEAELNETPEARNAGIAELRKRLEQLPEDQRPARLDDDYLVAFLRCTKYRLDIAEKKLVKLAKLAKQYPQYSTNLRAEEFQEMYGQGFMRILKGHDQHGRVISCLLPARMKDLKDPTVFMRWMFWVMDQYLDDPYMQVNGQVVIENFEGFSMLNMMVMNNIPRKLLNLCFQMQRECMPFRLRGIFVVNQPTYMTFIWAIVRPFMSEKMRSRVHFIGRHTSAFQDFIDPEVLPQEFGGTLDEAPTTWLEEKIAAEAAAGAAAGAAGALQS